MLAISEILCNKDWWLYINIKVNYFIFTFLIWNKMIDIIWKYKNVSFNKQYYTVFDE